MLCASCPGAAPPCRPSLPSIATRSISVLPARSCTRPIYDLARATRSLPHGEQFTLVALTGYGDATARQQGIEAGFDHHLTKPVDLDALEGLLASLSLNR
nr:hypothetical protein HUO10_005311 [Paraburkholderia busanensis]